MSRNLFTSRNTKECLDTTPNQYSKLTRSVSPRSTEETNEEENSRLSQGRDYDTSSEISGTKSLPLAKNSLNGSSESPRLGRSAPGILQNSIFEEHEAVTSFNSTSSECESELEHIFEDLDGPEHTSTPKGGFGCSPDKMRQRRRERVRLQDRLRMRYQDQER